MISVVEEGFAAEVAFRNVEQAKAENDSLRRRREQLATS
jgi:hypothetical protein